MKNLQLFSLMLLLVFAACQKDTEPEIIPTTILENYETKIENVTASVIGFVVDKNDDPVSDAQVKLGSQNFTTDEYGHFFLNDVTMNSRGTVVNVEKAGYFDGSRRFFPKENAKNRLKIKLLEKSFDRSFNSVNGGNYAFANGAVVDFDPNSIQTINGETYTGIVQVAAKWMDPTDLSTMDEMPGNLQGVNQESQEVALASFGMIVIELQDENGASLRIADNATAELTIFVPYTMQANAPAEIPLWSYNKEAGLWIEESVATLQNGFYVGEVSHFSFWNCDAPFPLVEFDLKLVDGLGLALPNTLVTIDVLDIAATSGAGYSDEDGVLSGLMPSNESLVVRVSNSCGDELYSETFGPFSDDTDLGEISIFDLDENVTTISGALECNGTTSTNGLVIVNLDGQKLYHYIVGDSFSFSFSTCESTVSVSFVVIDLDQLGQSNEITVVAGTSTDFGIIQGCEIGIENYLKLKYLGEEALYLGVTAIEDASWTHITFYIPTLDSLSMDIAFDGKQIGNYNELNQNSFELIDLYRQWYLNEPVLEIFEVFEYGAVGESIKGRFSGITTGGEAIEGDFSAIRE